LQKDLDHQLGKAVAEQEQLRHNLELAVQQVDAGRKEVENMSMLVEDIESEKEREKDILLEHLDKEVRASEGERL